MARRGLVSTVLSATHRAGMTWRGSRLWQSGAKQGKREDSAGWIGTRARLSIRWLNSLSAGSRQSAPIGRTQQPGPIVKI